MQDWNYTPPGHYVITSMSDVREQTPYGTIRSYILHGLQTGGFGIDTGTGIDHGVRDSGSINISTGLCCTTSITTAAIFRFSEQLSIMPTSRPWLSSSPLAMGRLTSAGTVSISRLRQPWLCGRRAYPVALQFAAEVSLLVLSLEGSAGISAELLNFCTAKLLPLLHSPEVRSPPSFARADLQCKQQ